MELIEVCDQNFLPTVNATFRGGGQNYILQGFNPNTHFINDGGGGAIEVIEEFPSSASSYVQVVEPSPTVLVNYIIGSNGSLIPVYDSLPMENTFTFLTGPAEPISEPTVPPHILDHMYAKKPKEPGTETPSKPRKRVKRKEPPPPPPPPVVDEYIVPEIMTANTTKVNIIRKGLQVNMPQTTFRPLVSSRPKILQNTKSTTASPQKIGGNPISLNDLSPPSSFAYTSNSSSPSASSTMTIAYPNESNRIILNGKSQIKSEVSFSSSPSLPTQTPSIYFIPPKATASDVSDIIGSTVGDNECNKTSFIVTTTADTEPEHTGQMCFVLPSAASATSPSSFIKTEMNTHHQLHKPSTTSSIDQVTTYQLNSDGTISAIPAAGISADDSEISIASADGGGGIQHQQQNPHNPAEMYNNDYSICAFVDDTAGGTTGGGVTSSTSTGGTFHLGGKQIYFSYE